MAFSHRACQSCRVNDATPSGPQISTAGSARVGREEIIVDFSTTSPTMAKVLREINALPIYSPERDLATAVLLNELSFMLRRDGEAALTRQRHRAKQRAQKT